MSPTKIHPFFKPFIEAGVIRKKVFSNPSDFYANNLFKLALCLIQFNFDVLGLDLVRLKLTGTLKSIFVIVAIIIAFLSGYLGLMVGLNTSVPIRVVESGSMCVPYGGACQGWLSVTHPFSPTLHRGDIIIIQGIDPKELKTNYPNSDIIVYKKPNAPTDTPIVHRIVTSYQDNGTLYFQTKGDGNGKPYPAVVNPSEYDSNSNIIEPDGQGVPANLVEGRVIMRIPYFGWITLLLRENSWGLPLIVIIIIFLIILEFVVPLAKNRKKTKSESITSTYSP